MSSGVIEKLLDVLYPRGLVCASCGREAVVDENGLCEDCAGGLELYNAAPPIKNIFDCTAAYVYNDVSGRMVKKLKYGGKTYLAQTLADAITLPEDWKIDAVVPVPLHKNRVRRRGFNQSELIAEALCNRYGLELRPELLSRSADTVQQAGLSGAARRRMLKEAFTGSEDCRGLSVLLVDDVRTTGTTLACCAAELVKCGCARVYAATVCYAKDDRNV